MNKVITMLCAVALIFAVSCKEKQQETAYASISFFIGDVKNNNIGVAIGDIIKESDIITTSPQASCDIKIGDSIIRIKEKSTMKFSMLAVNGGVENTTLGLDSGKMLCKPKKLLKDDSFTVKTPTAVAGVRGTQFSIEADANKTTRIKVYDGKVKVAKRVTALDQNITQVLENAAPIGKEETVIVTKAQADSAEKAVSEALKKDADITKVIDQTSAKVVVAKDDVKAFKVEEFKAENTEIISVQEKPAAVITAIKSTISKNKTDLSKADTEKSDKPAPIGRLYVTRSEVYYINNGRVEIEGKITSQPVKTETMVFVASETHLFGAQLEGPVLWKKQIKNDGKIEMKDGKVFVLINGQSKEVNQDTGSLK